MTISKRETFVQADESLIFPNKRIITAVEREKLIKDSLNTPVRLVADDIKDIIEQSIVSILIGETGSGKTTELAQMIHEVYPEDMVITNIPLVSATIGTANFVSDQLCAKTGNPEYIFGNGKIGYRTGKGVSSIDRAQISFNTYGLDYLHLSLGNYERFLNAKNQNIHIVLDEIHEKSEDFVFYLSKILDLSKKYPGRIKIYGASATVSDNYLDLLVDKFKEVSKDIPITRVEGRTFPIEDFEDNGASAVEKTKQGYNKGNSLLVFEKGKNDINKLILALQKELGADLNIRPFHSEISKEELENTLIDDGEQKIIVATNAARTGLTLKKIEHIVDLGKQKSQYYDEYGTPILISEDITYDAYMQNRGRAGRVKEGIATYIGETKINDLKLEAPSSVEIKIDEKKILMELIDGNNILNNESRGLHKYLFNPNKRMLKISYDWMKRAGLITKNEKITKYGYDALKFPVSVFNGRIILEAIENCVADDVISMISIIENKGFIKKEFNIKKFSEKMFRKDFSDLEIYSKLHNILCSTSIDDDILNMFVGAGLDRGLINYFKSLDGSEKFYKVVKDDLESIGLKFKNIERIDETIIKIKKYLSNNQKYISGANIELDYNEKKGLIQKSLLAGNLHRIYTGTGKNRLERYLEDQKGLDFEKSDTSFMTVGSGELYIGEPFIIGGTGDKDDKAILSFLTLVEAGDIEYFETKEYTEFKIKKEKIDVKDFSVDSMGDTFIVPKEIIKIEDKQKYLALNWLPYFLIEKNKYFRNFINKSTSGFDRDEFIKVIQQYTLGIYRELDPNSKEVNIDRFIEDKKILGLVLQSKQSKVNTLEKYDTKKENKKTVKIEDLEDGQSEFFTYVELSNKYHRTLAEAKTFISKNIIETDLITSSILEDFIEKLQTDEEYARIILFLKRLNDKKNNNAFKKELKESFVSFKNENDKLLVLKKRNSWLISFLNNLKKIKNGDDVTINELNIGTIDDKKLLLSDPIIKKFNFGDKINKGQSNLKQIRKLLNKINIDVNKVDAILISLQKLLFTDKRKFKRGLNGIGQFTDYLNNLKKENILTIGDIEENKVSSNAEKSNKKIKGINIDNNNIDLLISRIGMFKRDILDIRDDVESINFKDIIFNSVVKNIIYTKKFLYNVLINVVFEGDFIALNNKQEDKLFEKLNNIFKSTNLDSAKLIELIKNIRNFDLKSTENSGVKSLGDSVKGNKGISKINATKIFNTEKTNDRSSYENKLSNFILDIENILKIYKEENSKLETSIYDNNPKVVFLLSSIRNILLDFYPIDIVKVHENKILNFAKKIPNLKINGIDEEIGKLILSLPLIKSTKFNSKFVLLEEYKNLRDEILGLGLYNGIEKNKDEDYVAEILLLDKILEKLKSKTIKFKKAIEEIKNLD